MEGTSLCGVACYDAACRNFFGPELVAPDRRGRGIGRALLLSALHAMRADGYAYAIIGWAASVDFYQRAVGAVVIDGSTPGIYPATFVGMRPLDRFQPEVSVPAEQAPYLPRRSAARSAPTGAGEGPDPPPASLRSSAPPTFGGSGAELDHLELKAV